MAISHTGYFPYCNYYSSTSECSGMRRIPSIQKRRRIFGRLESGGHKACGPAHARGGPHGTPALIRAVAAYPGRLPPSPIYRGHAEPSSLADPGAQCIYV